MPVMDRCTIVVLAVIVVVGCAKDHGKDVVPYGVNSAFASNPTANRASRSAA
jgi:hypothetical protein